MARPKGAKNKRTLVREALAANSVLGQDTLVVAEAMGVVEKCMMHFFLRAQQEASKGEKADEKRMDAAFREAAQWAKEILPFRHAKIATIKLAGDPNEQKIGEQTLEQLRAGIMVDLAKLSGVLNLEALPAPQGIENFAPDPKANGSGSDDDGVDT